MKQASSGGGAKGKILELNICAHSVLLFEGTQRFLVGCG